MSSASILGSERMDGHSTEALALGDTALAAHDKLLGRHHAGPRKVRASLPTLNGLRRRAEI